MEKKVNLIVFHTFVEQKPPNTLTESIEFITCKPASCHHLVYARAKTGFRTLDSSCITSADQDLGQHREGSLPSKSRNYSIGKLQEPVVCLFVCVCMQVY